MRTAGPNQHGEFVMQYGHCIGHALESGTNYSLSHGEAIAIGMSVSAEVSLAKGIGGAELVNQHNLILAKYQLPIVIPERVNISHVLKFVGHDKGMLRGTPRLALLRTVGEVYKSRHGSFAYVSWPVLRRSLQNSKGRVKT
jgi:3-dehydroquinate synthetase